MSERSERSEKRKVSVQLIAKLMLILIFPFIFFQLIGDNPTRIIEQNTRVLAVVNEDLGEELEDGDTLHLGQELSTLLGEGSDYEWIVVNRNVAENGLEQNRFDAIIYISSDFTSNILTFEEENPVKASVQYKIQANLDAKHRQKVQREIERIKNDINKQMSTIYWGHVSQEVDQIRKRFEQIVEKEVAFQNAMYSFYTPGSQKLSSEVNAQKGMIEGILETTKSLGDTSDRNVDNAESAKERLLAFSQLIEDYKQYQKEQREIIIQKQEENKKAIEEGIKQYETVLNNGKSEIEERERVHPVFDKEREQVNRTFQYIQELFNTLSHQKSDYEKVRKEQVDVQIASMEALHKQLLNYYHGQINHFVFNQLESHLDKLKKDIGPPEQPLPLPEDGGEDESSSQNTASVLNTVTLDYDNPPSGNEENPEPVEPPAEDTEPIDMDELNNLLNGLLQLLNLPGGGEPSPSIEEQFQKIEDEIKQLQANIDTLEKEKGQLQSDYDELLKNYNDIKPIKNLLNSILNQVFKAIEKLERDILDHPTLQPNRKEVLSNIFEGELNPFKLISVIDYYAYLKSYYITLVNWEETGQNMMDEILKLEGLRKTLEEKLNVSGLELERLGDLEKTIDDTGTEVTNFNTLFSNLYLQVLDEYKTFADNEYKEIVTVLEDVQNETREVTTILNEVNNDLPEVKETPMVEDVKGEIFLNIHDQSITNLKTLSELLASLEERQDHLNSYTSQLQQNVNDVQAKADQLNTNWAMNVDFTKKVKEDVYGVLNNALVDGQNNGYVYDYLANPVQVSGETPPEKTVQTPPVVMLIIIVVSGLLIGFFSHYYSKTPFFVQLSLFLLLNIVVGLLIGIYGLNIYPMDDDQAIKWSALTILLLFACSGLVRSAFTVGPFTGLVVGIALIVYFVFPLLDMALPNFAFTHPISDLLMSVQYSGDQSSYYPMVAFLAILTIFLLSIHPIVKKIRTSARKDVPYDG